MDHKEPFAAGPPQAPSWRCCNVVKSQSSRDRNKTNTDHNNNLCNQIIQGSWEPSPWLVLTLFFLHPISPFWVQLSLFHSFKALLYHFNMQTVYKRWATSLKPCFVKISARLKHTKVFSKHFHLLLLWVHRAWPGAGSVSDSVAILLAFFNFVLFAVQFSPPAERAPAVELNLMSIHSFLPFRKIVQKEAKEKGVSFLSVP